MTDTPKFEVIDRRKFKAEEEREQAQSATTAVKEKKDEESGAPAAGPRLVVPDEKPESAAGSAQAEAAETSEESAYAEMPPPPTAEESSQQKSAYDASAQRLDDLVRAQNPAMGQQPPVGFEHLVQQLYLSAMIQMGAGAQEGQRPRLDILGARQTIDLMGVLAEKTKGNLTAAEDQTLQTVLFEVRMAFLELTNMITLQGLSAPPPPTGKH